MTDAGAGMMVMAEWIAQHAAPAELAAVLQLAAAGRPLCSDKALSALRDHVRTSAKSIVALFRTRDPELVLQQSGDVSP